MDIDHKLLNNGAVLGTITIPQSTAEPNPPYYQPVARDQQGHIYAINNGSCAFEEFPANTYGKVSPIRSVTCPGTLYALPAFDDAGNVYISPSNTSPMILEYPPTGSGNVPPIRTISMSNPDEGSFLALGVDGGGNLYALLSGYPYPNRLYEFAPGSTTGVQILSGVSITTFAVDDAGDISAVVQEWEGSPSRSNSTERIRLHCWERLADPQRNCRATLKTLRSRGNS